MELTGVCVCLWLSVLDGAATTHDAVCVDVTQVSTPETLDLAHLHSKRLVHHITTALGCPACTWSRGASRSSLQVGSQDTQQ